MSKIGLQIAHFLPPLCLCPSAGPKDRCFGLTSMLLATAICFGFVIKMCTASTTNPDLFNDVFVCVEKDPLQNVTMVTWTIAAYVQARCCDLLYFENLTSLVIVEPNLPPSGTFHLTSLKESARYVVQITCFVSLCQNGSSKSFKSSEVSFLSGSEVNQVCSLSQPPHLIYGQIYVCIQETQGAYSDMVQWWTAQSAAFATCTMYYTTFSNVDFQHRTGTFGDLPPNGSMLLTEWLSSVTMRCFDSNNKPSSGIVKFANKDSMQRVCGPNDVRHTLPNTAKISPTQPTHFSGLHVSSLAQGLALAFSIVFGFVVLSVLACKRYKRYVRRRSQRLLRIETEEEEAAEEAAMQEFQRMV